MRRVLLLAAAAALAACGHGRLRPAPGEAGEVIEAEGWAPVDAADPAGTRQRALADALKKAVEKVVGVYISAKTRVDQAVNVDQRILAKVEGYVRRYDVLGEREEAGLHKTRIKALVLYQKVGEELRALGLAKPPPPPGDPQVRVLVRPEGPWSLQAAAGVRTALRARGFSVLGSGDAQAGDILVEGQAEAHPFVEPRLAGLLSARARLSAEARKEKTGQVLASASQEASAVDVSHEVAQAKAAQKAGELAGETLARDLSAALGPQTAVAVRVEGLQDLGQARQLIDDIRLNPGVAAVSLADFGAGRAGLQVVADDMTAADLAAVIVRSRKFRLSAESVTAYEVRLRLR